MIKNHRINTIIEKLKLRPFATIGFTYFLTQAACGLLPLPIVSTILILLLVGLACFITFRNRIDKDFRIVVLLILCASLASSSLLLAYNFIKFTPASKLDGQRALITGQITDEPETQNGRYRYIIDTSEISINGVPQKVRVMLTCQTPISADPGDTIVADVQFANQDDITKARRSKGIQSFAHLAAGHVFDIIENGWRPVKIITSIRESLRNAIDSVFPKDLSVLLRGLLLGDTSLIHVGLAEDFRTAGLAHLLAVAGMHLSVLTAGLAALLKRLRLNYRLSSAITIPFIIIFMAITGFSYAVTRAGIMMILFLISQAAVQRADSLNSLGFSLLAICLFSPFAAMDIGLQLSASTTWALIVIYPPVMRAIRSRIKMPNHKNLRSLACSALSTAVMSLVAAICVTPLSMLYFSQVSLIAPLSNILCGFAASVFIMFGGAAILLSYIPFVGQMLGVIASVIPFFAGKYLLWMIHFLAGVPGASVTASFDFLPVFLLGCITILVIWYIFYGKRPRRMISLSVCIMMIFLSFTAGAATHFTLLRSRDFATVYPTENGSATAIVAGGHCYAAVSDLDSYSASAMARNLRSLGINKIDALFYISSDRYADEVLLQLNPDSIFASEISDELSHAAESMNLKIQPLDGLVYSVSKNHLTITAYIDAENNRWLSMTCGGFSLLICPESGDCLPLPDKMKAPDCAVISSRKVANVIRLSPTLIAVSAKYGEGAVIRSQLQARGMRNVYATGSDGAIRLYSDGNGVRAEKIRME